MLRRNNGESAEDTTTSIPPRSTVTTPPSRPLPLPSNHGEGIPTPRQSTRPNKVLLSPSLPASAHPAQQPPGEHQQQHPPRQLHRFSTRPLPFDGPRSPRAKLDALIAEELNHPSAASTPTPTPTSPARPPYTDTPPSKPPLHATLRTASATVPSSPAILPPVSPAAMPPPSRPNRPETRPTPPARNHSIDSAASSLSSSNAGAVQRAGPDANSATPPNMATLIAAAESPEAAFLNLWKEKQSAANHNAQLWRLVEKQRSMIIGLQKDLERSLKDKDRYRKKLKEYTSQVPPIPGAPQRAHTFDSVVERDDSESPAPGAKPAEHKASPLIQETSVEAQLVPDAQMSQSPTHSSETLSASNPGSSLNSPAEYSVKPLNIGTKGLGLNTAGDEDVSPVEPREPQEPQEPQEPENTQEPENSQEPPKSVTPLPVTPPPVTPPAVAPSEQESANAPALSLTQATPDVGGNGFDSPSTKSSHPSRKGPPAPLNLSKPGVPSAHLHHVGPADNEDSDDYDDVLEVDEIPIVDRGRRKTREEDDRVRESMALKEEAARSKSKKKKSGSGPASAASMSDNASAASAKFSPPQTGLPLSPRHPPANSLNALLSPTNSESSTMAQRSAGSPTPLMSPPLLSPGLPNSPRPGDRPIGSPLPRNPKQTLASPPLSPRSDTNGVSQPLSRPPRQPVPLPPNTPLSYTSPQATQSKEPSRPKSSDLLKPSSAQPSAEADNGSVVSDGSTSEHVYRGLVSDQYPGLLLPPNALPSIEVKVSSSRLRPSRLSYLAPKPQEEDPVFHLAIYARSDRKQLWRMEKTIMALPALDQQLKSLSDFQGKLPDRILFSGHAPAKIDARRTALNQYFDIILETPMDEKAALVVCEFFSTDVMGAQNADTLAPEPVAPQATPAPTGRQQKEGYLTKRGKNFGGWKARYFILDGPEFRYYEMVGGAHLGTIKLLNAQIGKQSQQQSNSSPQRRDDSEDNQYRHAFLILEPKRKDSTSLVRHVLCAESDEERDAWVDALLQHVDWQEETSPTTEAPPHASSRPAEASSHSSSRPAEASSHSSSRPAEASSHASNRPAAPTKPQVKDPAVLTKPQVKDPSRPRKREVLEQEKAARLQALSYEDAIAAEAPVRGPGHREAKDSHGHHSPKNGSLSSENSARHHPSISGPSNGAPIQDAGSWGNRSLAAPMSVKDKKRSIFGFGSRGRTPDIPNEQYHPQQQQGPERIIQQNRNVFGIPLAEAVEYTQPIGLRDPLPSVVFRCLEYLRDKVAMNEEGIFRLSGSNIVIRGLRERFNTEGDVKLVDGQYYDIHAVASLLKLYLRELPASILTRELHLEFLKVLDLDERSKKIQCFNVLVHRLPTVNFELIRHMALFLIEIVENAGINKMTVRNVGIVFAPTLNIPAPLISFFLTDYPDIFGTPPNDSSSSVHEMRSATPQQMRTATPQQDEVRSPRRQMFSDVPTPAHSEASFTQPYQQQPYQQQSYQQQPYQQQPYQQQYDRAPAGFPMGQPPQHLPQPPQQQHHQHQQYAGYDTGHLPMRPSYDAPAYEKHYQQGEGYGSLKGSSQPGSARDQKQRRRESGMLLMGMGQRKGSNGSLQGSLPSGRPREEHRANNPMLIREETAFD
ncbi:hypothetical protein P280DRAFT_477594 [Massarina eburnea CBS 473.64]|uniref:RhoGAP-domain-containing protein n=1 Tax=Massarina eburnea CBS 473.64 TaxID=1395130 RepID=A0A6A6SDB7_9PLEO|nr:hypothetical protein P280DRAFT_477594 [Massarina eburnea CBS 473.64]